MAWTTTTLKDAIRQYLVLNTTNQTPDSTFEAQLDNIIVQAEQGIVRSVQHPAFTQYATLPTVASTSTVSVSTQDPLAIYSMTVLGQAAGVVDTGGAGKSTNIQDDSPIIVGVGTSWLSTVQAGNFILFGSNSGSYPTGTWYQIQSVDSDTQLTLTTDYVGITLSGVPYTVYSDGPAPVLGSSVLIPKQFDFIIEAFAGASEGRPKFYAWEDEATVILGPTPDAIYNIRMSYWGAPTSITVDSTTWLGDNQEDLLLYACLVEAYRFIKGAPEMLTMYEKRYVEALAAFKMQGEGYVPRDNARNEQHRIPRQ